jgi:hypothetical protein
MAIIAQTGWTSLIVATSGTPTQLKARVRAMFWAVLRQDDWPTWQASTTTVNRSPTSTKSSSVDHGLLPLDCQIRHERFVIY